MRPLDSAAAISQARRLAGLSKRELARRARTSPAALVTYESGAREPGLPTLQRIVAAAGFMATVVLTRVRPVLDPHVNGARLVEVLDLADRLPKRRAARRLGYPPFGR
jgi:transcriptional regulator with XRE-family HTH domain